MEKLTRDEVEHVADLARLAIMEEEYDRYGKQLYDILSEVEKIVNVDVEGCEEIMISPITVRNNYKSDTVGRMLSQEEIFKNVKNATGDYIVVPKVLND